VEAILAFSLLPQGVGPPLHFLILGSLSALIMGAAKGGFAGSIGMLSVPLMIYACGGSVPLALGMFLPLLIICDYVAVVYWRGKWDWPTVRSLLPGIVVGITVGSVVLWAFLRFAHDPQTKQVSDAAMRMAIGVIALVFVTIQALRAWRGEMKVFRPTALHAFIAGSTAGLTSTLSHSAGPITAMYLLPQQMPKQRYVATTTLYYWIGNQAKVLPYLLLGQFNADSLSGSATLAPAVVVGALVGIYLHTRVNQKIFNIVIYGLLTLVGGHLTVTSVLAIWGN